MCCFVWCLSLNSRRNFIKLGGVFVFMKSAKQNKKDYNYVNSNLYLDLPKNGDDCYVVTRLGNAINVCYFIQNVFILFALEKKEKLLN